MKGVWKYDSLSWFFFRDCKAGFGSFSPQCSYSEEWLDFILNCRSGKDSTDYDLVVGGVANDKVFNTVELFFDGLIDKAEAINRLRYDKPNLQICFRTEKALSLLHFEGSETVLQRTRFYFRKNTAVSLSVLPDSRRFHWMRR